MQHRHKGQAKYRYSKPYHRPLTLLVGKSGTGKDHLVRAFGLKPVVSFTTRPMRPKEIDGVNHWFVDDHVFDLHRERGTFAAYTEFNGYRYWTVLQDIADKDVYIIDPAGIDYLAEQKKRQGWRQKTRVVYVTAPWYRRLARMLGRGDTVFQALSRLWHDAFAFRNVAYDTIIKT